MPTCASCKQNHFGMFELKGGFCKKCAAAIEEDTQTRKKRSADLSSRADLAKMVLTTETSSDLVVTERLGIVSAECAFGMNVFKDLFAGVRDVVGGRSDAIQKTLRDSRDVVLQELRVEAYELGADAVIAVSFEYVELSAAGNMVLLVATGTAVKLG